MSVRIMTDHPHPSSVINESSPNAPVQILGSRSGDGGDQSVESWLSANRWLPADPLLLANLLRKYRHELCDRTAGLAVFVTVLWSANKIDQAYTGDFGDNKTAYDCCVIVYNQLSKRGIDKVTLLDAWNKSGNRHLAVLMHERELHEIELTAVELNAQKNTLVPTGVELISQNSSSNDKGGPENLELDAGETNELMGGDKNIKNLKPAWYTTKIFRNVMIIIIIITLALALCGVVVAYIFKSPRSTPEESSTMTEKSSKFTFLGPLNISEEESPNFEKTDPLTTPVTPIILNETLVIDHLRIQSPSKLFNLTATQVKTDTVVVAMRQVEVATFVPPPFNSSTTVGGGRGGSNDMVINHVTTLHIIGPLSHILMDYLLQKFPKINSILMNITAVCTSPPSLWKKRNKNTLRGVASIMGPLNLETIEKFTVIKNKLCHVSSIIWQWHMPNLNTFTVQDSHLTSDTFGPIHKFLDRHSDTLFNATFCRSPLCDECGYLDINFRQPVVIRQLTQFC